MLRILLELHAGGLHVRLGSYVVLTFCGVVAALAVALRRSRETGLPPRELMTVFTASLAAGYLGARGASILQTGTAGLVLYGGLIAGFSAGLLVSRLRKLPPLEVADLAAPAVLLAAAFGRIGCLLAGCCYGVVAEHGIAYPRFSPAWRSQIHDGRIGPLAPTSLPTVPVVLAEAIVLFLLFAILSDLRRRRPRPGAMLAAAGLLYPAWRFAAEFLRADNLPYWPGGWTFSQGISAALMAMSALFLLRRRAPATASRAVERRPASLLQFAAMLAVLAMSLTNLNCGSHEERPTSGVHQYRSANVPAPSAGGQKPAATKEKDDDHDFLDDCAGECIDECTDACIDSMCEEACSDKPEQEPEPAAPVELPPAPVERAFGRLQTGRKYRGSFDVEAVINRRLQVVLKVDGQIWTNRKLEDGSLPVHLRVKSAGLKVGDARWDASGDVDLQWRPDGGIRLLQSTLPAGFMEALTSLRGIAGNYLQGLQPDGEETDLSRVVQEELREKMPRAEFGYTTRIEGVERWGLGQGTVVEDPSGTLKLYWELTR